MKIAVAVKELVRVLTAVASVVEAKVTVPALQFARVSVSGGKGLVTGGDFSTVITVPASFVSAEDGELLLPARKTLEILSSVQGDLIQLETENETVVLKAGRYKVKLTSMPATQYPKTDPTPASSIPLNLTAANLAIGRVEFAVPTGEGKFVNSILLLENDGAKTRAVGTDGFRIAVADVPAAGSQKFKMLLPRTALGFIADLSGETAQFAESDTNYFFTTEDKQILIRKSPALFPPYEKFLAGLPATTVMEIGTAELLSAVHRAIPVADATIPKATFFFQPEAPTELAMTTVSEFGATDDGVVVENAKGNGVSIVLNLRYVEQFLSKAEGKLGVSFNSSKNPVVFRTTDGYQYFLLPTKPEEKAK